jgi:3-isopropylmalate/(R)-2-methylmalate dehydratase small subunit
MDIFVMSESYFNMKKFSVLISKVAAYTEDDINTDQIIPSEFLKDVNADLKFGLFAYLRRDLNGKSNPNFILEKKNFIDSKILLVGRNFGCGSSREHAVWALQEFGFECIIAKSFSDLFKSNCLKNGVLTIELPDSEFKRIESKIVDAVSPIVLHVNLNSQVIFDESGNEIAKFHIESNSKALLIQGLDEIDLTLNELEKIKDWESKKDSLTRIFQQSIN